MTSLPSHNRRMHRRYGFTTNVTYRVLPGTGASAAGQGSTVNMSAGGILLRFDRAQAPDTCLELSLEWPGLLHGAPRVRLLALARVLRTERGCSAVRIVRHEFRVADGPTAPCPGRGLAAATGIR